ncbi:HAD-IA family hydrolase [Jannaschia aquimarina]|uniref:HAD-IA family hydrolase n=1 Tax=Jannaschia aquimarina TaxID=935700 RepID=UPI0005C50BD0|nr:HAD-IA family hydrolase [Jannaschia aquimarina]
MIFDLDGTLCDTSADLIAAANAAFRELGRDIALDHDRPEDRATALRGGKAMLRLGLSRLGAVDDDEVDAGYQPLLDAYESAVCVHTTFFPGAREANLRLREAGWATGICTNKPERMAHALMTELGARQEFDSLVGADTLPVRKPDPAPLREAVARAGGDPMRYVLVGDTTTDRDTARAAGVPVLLVGFLSPVAHLEGDAELDGFHEIETALSAVLPLAQTSR